MSNFVDPPRPSNVWGNLFFLFFFLLQRVSTTVKLLFVEFLTSYEIWKVDACHPMEPALFYICGSDESIPRALPLLLLIFDLEYIYLIWCSAALRARDGVIWVGQGYAAGISAKLRRCRRRIRALSLEES